MRLPIADPIVEWDLLLQVVWSALAAGLTLMIAVSFAIVGAARAADARRDGDTLDTIFFSAVFVLGVAVSLGAVVFGVLTMTSKG